MSDLWLNLRQIKAAERDQNLNIHEETKCNSK